MSQFFVKSNKIDKYLARVKKKKIKTTEIREIIQDVIMNKVDFKNIIRAQSKELCLHNMTTYTK